MVVIFLIIFVDMLGFGILLPIIPQLLANPLSPYFLLPAGVPVTDGYIVLGFLTASFPLMQFLSTPVLGQLSDKYGRKKLLTVSLIGTVIARLLFAYGIMTRSIVLLFISRAFDGITGGNISVAQAAIADITEPHNRAKNFGLIGAAFGLGFIVGPYLGGRLSDPSVVSWFDAATPFWFAAGLSLLNVISVLYMFPETLKKTRADLVINWGKSFINIVEAVLDTKLRALFLTSFIYMSGFTFFTTFFSVFLINHFNFNQGNIGDYFAYVGLWITFTQVVITRRASSRFEETEILRFSIFGMAIALVLYFVPTVWWGILLVTPLFAICNGLTNANLTGLISRSTDSSRQGEILGIGSSVQALAQSIPPVLSGFIAAKLAPEAPIWVSALCIGIAGLLFWKMWRLPKEETPAMTVGHIDFNV